MEKLKNAICLLLLILALGISIFNHQKLEQLATLQAKQVEQLAELENKQEIQQQELLIKTDPAYVDYSLRTHFDKILKETPNQVRGIDGKLPRDR